jgi:hypothetical protein
MSGLMAKIRSVAAPPLALVCQDRPAAEARPPTLAAVLAIGCAVALIGLFAGGWAGLRDVWLAAPTLPPTGLGLRLSRRLNGRVDRRCRPATLCVSSMAALILVPRGLA